MENILPRWNRNRESQVKRLLILYKIFDQRIERTYSLPSFVRTISGLPLGVAYLTHLIILRFASYLFDYAALAVSKFRTFDQFQVRTEGKLPENNEKCRVLLLYAKNCEFSEFDLDLASNIFDKFGGHKTIIVNCDCVKTFDSHRLKPNIDYLIVKPNWGYDFDGYAEVIKRFSKSEFETLTFVNNSVVVTSNDDSWIIKMEESSIKSGGASGLIQSISPLVHFQSFAFTLSRKSLNPQLIKWFSKVTPLRRKQAIVRFYELGLAKQIRKLKIACSYESGFEKIRKKNLEDWEMLLGIYFDSVKYRVIFARTSAGLGVNPTHHHWRFILDQGIPLIKRELIVSNPEEIPDVYDFLLQKYPKILDLKK